MVGIAAIRSSHHDAFLQPPIKPAVNSYVYLLTTMAVVGGFLFGYDTGIVSSAMLYVDNNPDMQPLNNFWKELIVAITPGFAGIGSLIAGTTADKYGRKPIIIVSSIIFTLGAIFCSVAFDKWMLLFGRVLLGLAIGLASMIVPVYVSESSPTHIRGASLATFNAMITFGQMAANIFAGIFAFINPDYIGWRLMFGFAAIPAIIQFIGFLYLPESPRWLYKHRSEEECHNVLRKVYHGEDAWVKYELSEIATSIEEERQCENKTPPFLRILSTPHVRKALLIGCSLQMFQQLGGINTIMYYTGAIIKGAGVKDNHTTIWLSVGISAVNFIGTIIPLFLVEKWGRKKILLISSFGVIGALCMMGGAFLLVNQDTAKTLPINNGLSTNLFNSSAKNFNHCGSYSNCDYCVTDDRCGFCSPTPNGNDVKMPGYCLPANPDGIDKGSTTGFCSVTNGNLINATAEYEWGDVFCHTKYTPLPIIIMVIYLLFFASGMSPVPWILNAEFYPLWARGTAVSISTSTNWFINLFVSLTFLSLTEAITKYGTFFFYAGCTFIGTIIFILFVPETKDKSLDQIEALFMTKTERKEFEAKRNITTLDLNFNEKS